MVHPLFWLMPINYQTLPKNYQKKKKGAAKECAFQVVVWSVSYTHLDVYKRQVYANSFIAPRFAAIGDAAVGMHPVTAHGFNFGLLSITTLMNCVQKAQKRNKDIGAPQVLGEYDLSLIHI